MQRFSIVLLAVSLITSSAVASYVAQQEWAKKPFEQWTKSDAEAVLNDSQWTVRQEIRLRFDRDVQAAAGAANIASSAEVEVDRDLPVDFLFLVRLRSALPIRQALVRLRQLNPRIDKKEQVAFDAQTKGLLECPACAANYVVTLSSKSTNRPGADAAYAVFKGGRLADLQRYVYIANEHGDRRQLVHFVPPKAPGDEAIFFFPRLDDKGAPLLAATNRTLLINLSDKQATSIGTFKIDVSKLIVNGKVEF